MREPVSVTIVAHIKSKKQDIKNIKKCLGIPGIVYNFTNQNLVSFEGNIGSKGDLPLVANMNFETTAPSEIFLTQEQKKMFVVSYTLIFAFHPKLNLNRVIMQRSFGHSLLKLATIDYLTEDQLKFVDKDSINQLKDGAINVSERRCQNAIAQMFAVELKFASSSELKLFTKMVQQKIQDPEYGNRS